MRIRSRAGAVARQRAFEAEGSRELIPRVLGRALRGDGAAVRQAALQLLSPSPDDAVLEVGCGDGRLLLELAVQTPHGVVVGLEPDAWMLRHATARTRRLIERDRVRLLEARSSDLSALADASFDKVCAIDVIYFWSDPERDLAEIRRVVKPGGSVLLGYVSPVQPEEAPRSRDIVCRTLDVERWLWEAGFVGVESLAGAPGDDRGRLSWTYGIRPATDAGRPLS